MRVRVRYELTGALRFFGMGGFALVVAAGLWFASGNLPPGGNELAARLPLALRMASGFAVGFALVLFSVGAIVVALGRGGLPDHYQYDLAKTDLLASTGFVLCLAGGAASVGSIGGPGVAAGAFALVALIFAPSMGWAAWQARHARRVLPPPTDFWPCQALEDNPPALPPSEPSRHDTFAGVVYAWNQVTPRGRLGVLFFANPELDVGEEAPAGRVVVLERAYDASDIESWAKRAIGLD